MHAKGRGSLVWAQSDHSVMHCRGEAAQSLEAAMPLLPKPGPGTYVVCSGRAKSFRLRDKPTQQLLGLTVEPIMRAGLQAGTA